MSAKPYVLMTETTCDLPQSYLQKHNISAIPLTYSVDDVEFDGTIENSHTPHEFYEMLKKGPTVKTAQTTPEKVISYFEKAIKEGFDILHISFSSGLSGSYQSATIARDEMLLQYPDAKIICIDSLCASLGQGLLIDYAEKLHAKDTPIDEVAMAVEKMKLKVCHYFTVDDLNHLYRGGRVSKTAAMVGTMLGIKPVMHVDDEGRLIAIGKVRGRKTSLNELVDKMGSKMSDYKNPYVFISHGDSLEDAKYVAELIKKKYSIGAEIINHVGPVIGSHSGPGTIALFFIGSDRAEKSM